MLGKSKDIKQGAAQANRKYYQKKNVVLTYRLRNQYDEDADDADDELCLLDD